MIVIDKNEIESIACLIEAGRSHWELAVTTAFAIGLQPDQVARIAERVFKKIQPTSEFKAFDKSLEFGIFMETLIMSNDYNQKYPIKTDVYFDLAPINSGLCGMFSNDKAYYHTPEGWKLQYKDLYRHEHPFVVTTGDVNSRIKQIAIYQNDDRSVGVYITPHDANTEISWLEALQTVPCAFMNEAYNKILNLIAFYESDWA